MATASSLLSKDQFLCCICLDVFTQPVSLPCGHNFCKACITNCWNSTGRGLFRHCQCPMCKETFKTRPELRVNALLSGMVEQFKKSVQVTDEQEGKDDVSGGMLCDVCIDTKLKAVKSCLVCLTSYCETHLEPHRRVLTLKTHQLVEPLGSMEDRMCKKHNKILELFCREEQMCICILCSQTDHRSHDVVALEDESEKKKEEMRETKTKCEVIIRWVEAELQDMRYLAENEKEVAEKETAVSVEVFTVLMASIQKRMAEVMEMIERKQREVEQEAEQWITRFQQEIAELQMTSTECEKLSRSEDHFQVLMYSCNKSLLWRQPYKEIPLDKKLSAGAGTVRAAVTKMEKTLNEGMEALIKQLEGDLDVAPSLPPRLPPTSPPPLATRSRSAGSAHQPTSSIEPASPSPSSIKPSCRPKPSASSARSPQALFQSKALAQTITELQQKLKDKK